VSGKTVFYLVTHGPYLSALEMHRDKALYELCYCALLWASPLESENSTCCSEWYLL